jgi:chemotaxis protein methyltransferase CheR
MSDKATESSAQGGVAAEVLARVSELVSERAGLAFSGARQADLARGIEHAARELQFPTADAYARRLLDEANLPGPMALLSLETLVSHVVVGETYFFREPASLEALRTHVLPELVRARYALVRGSRRLRIWSAGCGTGEEAYTLAMLLELAVPDLEAWDVTLLATDINVQALRIAEAAAYGEWSFRGVAPEIRRRFFQRRTDGLLEVIPRVRRRVEFACLNLAQDHYPSPANNTSAMDIIVCRNVLMYFEPARAKQAIGRFEQALCEGGWLALSAVEQAQKLSQYGSDREAGETRLGEVRLDECVLYRKAAAGAASRAATPAAPPRLRRARKALAGASGRESRAGHAIACADDSYEAAMAAYRRGEYAHAETVAAVRLARHPREAKTIALLARLHADRGQLDAALEWSKRALALDKLDPIAHYVRARILAELGRHSEAADALRRAIFIDHDFALAHYALGMLARTEGHAARARRHLQNAHAILARKNAPDEVTEAEGITAGQLARIIGAASGLA